MKICNKLPKKLSLLTLCVNLIIVLFSCSENQRELILPEPSPSIHQPRVKIPVETRKNKIISANKKSEMCQPISLKFFQADHAGKTDLRGSNYVIIFNPKSQKLDFKVSLGLAHNLYAKNVNGKFRQDYIPKRFHEIINDENALLNGRKPIAAINGDYIDIDNKPQGLNISRGVDYSGVFKDKRSSFGISGGRPEERKATIQKGRRTHKSLNYNIVGGNGRFYQNGKFKNICQDLGDYACYQETSRSMAAISAKGYVIWLVNNSYGEKALYPDQFDDALEGIAQDYCLGKIQEGMLFDGGWSTGLYFDNRIYVENSNPIGSVFLIYETQP